MDIRGNTMGRKQIIQWLQLGLALLAGLFVATSITVW